MTRIHPAALAFVAGFPAAIGGLALLAASTRSLPDDGALPLGVGLLTLSGIVLVLGLGSSLRVFPDRVSVRFFGVRSTTVRFADLSSATLGMTVPTISFAITLRDRSGRKAVVHANWWREERSIMAPICRAILELDVPVDRSTARVVASVLGVRRPRARIVHHGLLNKDRTW
jgi:hypothetical protein